MKNQGKDLQRSLLIRRLTVFLVMFMWNIDKFINPGHATNVFGLNFTVIFEQQKI